VSYPHELLRRIDPWQWSQAWVYRDVSDIPPAHSGNTVHNKNLALKVQATYELIEARGIGEPYDAVLEYWWNDARDLQEKYESPEARSLFEEMKNYQAQFIDMSRSTAFFTEDEG